MKNKICRICNTVINTDKEFVEVKHYAKIDVILSKGYYHVKCFRDRLSGNFRLKELQDEAFSFIKAAKRKIGVDDEEVVKL